MSRTLADVEAYQVYINTEEEHVWKDGRDRVLCRRSDGRITSLGPVQPDHVTIIDGPCLGHVRDDPWRKADAGQPGSLADAHNRIDALQTRLDADSEVDRLASLVNHLCVGLASAETRIAALEQRPSVADKLADAVRDPSPVFGGPLNKPKIGEVRLQTEPTPPPANPTQPPDVAVYRISFSDGGYIETAYPAGDVNFARYAAHNETRTVIDAFEGLGWDKLRRWGLVPKYVMDQWGVEKIINNDLSSGYVGQSMGSYSTEREALTAARAIARKEGWQ